MVSLEECTSFCYPHLQNELPDLHWPLAVSFYALFASLSSILIMAIMYFAWQKILQDYCLALLCFHLLLMACFCFLLLCFLFALLILLAEQSLRHSSRGISLTVIQLKTPRVREYLYFFYHNYKCK